MDALTAQRATTVKKRGRVTIDVSALRLPGGDEPREFFLALWGPKDKKLSPLTDERLITSDKTVSFRVSDLSKAWLIARAYRVGRLREEADPELFDAFDALADEKPVFRRPLGVAAVDLSEEKPEWRCQAALYRPTTSDNLLTARVFAKLPRLLPSILRRRNDDFYDPDDDLPICDPPPPPSSSPMTGQSPGMNSVEPGQTCEFLITARLDAPSLVTDAERIRCPSSLLGCLDDDCDEGPQYHQGKKLVKTRLRDELYVTIDTGAFSQDQKFAARSVEVKARLLHSETGALAAGSIVSRGGRSNRGGRQYRSATHYHANRPTWEETFRIDLPDDDDLSKYHLHLSLAHCRHEARKTPRTVFAFAFLPLSMVEAARQVHLDGPQMSIESTRHAITVLDRDRRLSCALPVLDGDHRLACFKPIDSEEKITTPESDSENSDDDVATLAMTHPPLFPDPQTAEKTASPPRLTRSISKETAPPTYLKGAAQERSRRISPAGAFLALGTSLRRQSEETNLGVASNEKDTTKKEWLVVRTALVSERRAPGEFPELHALLRWRDLESGKKTVRALKNATAKIVSFLQHGEGPRRLWPPRLVYRNGIKALLSILIAKRDDLEPPAAYGSLATILAATLGAEDEIRGPLRRALMDDAVLPDIADAENFDQFLKQRTSKDLRRVQRATSVDTVDSDLTTDSPTGDWMPSAGAHIPRQNSQNDEIPSVTQAEESWARFLAESAAGARSGSDEHHCVDFDDTTVASMERQTDGSLHATLLTSVAAHLDDDDDDDDTVSALDTILGIACASFARSGGVANEERNNGDFRTTLDLVDDVLDLVIKNGKCLASLAGVVEALSACFPQSVVAERAVRLVDALGSDESAVAELTFLRFLARSPVAKDKATRCAVARVAATHVDNDAALVRGLAAQILGEVVAKDQAIARAHLIPCLDATTKAARRSTASPKKTRSANSQRRKKPTTASEPPVPRISMPQKRPLSLRMRPRSQNKPSSPSTTPPTPHTKKKKTRSPRYWDPAFDASHSATEASRPGVGRDAMLDLTATSLALVDAVGTSLRDAEIFPVVRCFRALAAVSVDGAPKAWCAFGDAHDKAARLLTISDDSDLQRDFFALGLAILEAPDTDVDSMSDDRLSYLFSQGLDAIADLRTSTVLRMNTAWATATTEARLDLGAVVLPRAPLLLGASSKAIAALAATLVTDIAVAELELNGHLAQLEKHLIDVLDDAFCQSSSRVRGVAEALATVLPAALKEKTGWRSTLERVLELHSELATLARPDAGDLERACAYGRVVARDGPLLRPDVTGRVRSSWASRAARRATAIADLMADQGDHLEAGLGVLRAAEAHDLGDDIDEPQELFVGNDSDDDLSEEEDGWDDSDDDGSEDQQPPTTRQNSSERSSRGRRSSLEDPVDVAIEAAAGPAAGARARARRAASRLFDQTVPPAWELALACSETSITELRKAEHSIVNRRQVRQALAVEMRRAATYYDKLDALPQRRPCVIFRCRFDGSMHLAQRLRNNEFAFRGDPGDQLVDFIAHLRTDVHADLELVPSSGSLDDLEDDLGPPRFQASTLTPADDAEGNFSGLLRPGAWPAPLSERAFGLADANAPWKPTQVYVHEWPVKKRDDDLLGIWVERRYLVLAEPLAAATRWVPVAASRRQILNPMELAVRQLNEKNQQLNEILTELRDVTIAEQRHTMAVNGCVDAAVNGGLGNWRPLLTGDYENSHPDILADLNERKTSVLADLRKAIEDHLGLVTRCVQAHHDKCPPAMRPLAMHIEQHSWPKFRKDCQDLLSSSSQRLL